MSDITLATLQERSLDTLSHGGFFIAITGFVALFIVVSMIGASLSYGWTFAGRIMLYLGFVLVCMAVAIGGGSLASLSPDPTVSAFGGAICAFAIGLVIGPFVASFEKRSVVQAFILSTTIVIVTGFIGALLPHDLSAWGAPLFGLLIGAIVIQFGASIMSAFGRDTGLSFTVLDWAVLILFCFIMVYDLNKAQDLARTYDNAIDVAVNVFMNLANILIRILALMGESKN